jgi:hypothetical protein
MSDELAPIGMDPNQIRAQLADRWRGDMQGATSAESFSQVIWQTVLKETLDLDMMGTGEDGFASSMYGDWVKEGFSAAIAAQLAQQNPLPMPGAERGPQAEVEPQ